MSSWAKVSPDGSVDIMSSLLQFYFILLMGRDYETYGLYIPLKDELQ